MGILSAVKSALVKEQQQPVSVPDAWAGQKAREAEVHTELNELNARIQHIETTVLGPLRLQKQELAGLKARRLHAGAAALIDGKPEDLQSIDADIATREARIAALEKDSASATTAMATLSGRVQEKHRELALLKQDGLRVGMRQLETALEDFAPEFARAVEAYKSAVVKMSALAMARDRIGPKVAGNTPIGSNGLAEVTVYVPNLPAYEGMGRTYQLRQEAESRMHQILSEMNIRL